MATKNISHIAFTAIFVGPTPAVQEFWFTRGRESNPASHVTNLGRDVDQTFNQIQFRNRSQKNGSYSLEIDENDLAIIDHASTDDSVRQLLANERIDDEKSSIKRLRLHLDGNGEIEVRLNNRTHTI